MEAFDAVAPDPSSMIESLRATGYTLSTAVADLIDNSIAAAAKNVWVTFHWQGAHSWVRIVDDGEGMSEAVLRDAMRLGSRHPLDERPASDLGRFGLGLKTASLSQCRRLTVASKAREGDLHVRRWDLNHLARPDVQDWQLLRSAAPGSESLLELPHDSDHGTVVLWESIDRLVHPEHEDQEGARKHFLREIEVVEQHLSMVFHRFLADRRLQIRVNEHPIQPWDPFLEAHPATQTFPDEPISLANGAKVRVKGFVLPHKDRLGDDEHSRASGPGGWNEQQGFYVYRNDRLILPGSWLGLGRGRAWTKEEHYKLARIAVEIPNSMDHLWQLDVKKSKASPPPVIRDRLYNLASAVRKRAREVFGHRGRYGPRARRQSHARPWKTRRISGTASYRIDRQHVLVRNVLSAASPAFKAEIDAMLRVIEETVPVQQIWLDTAEHPDATAAPFETADDAELRQVLTIAYRSLLGRGYSQDEASNHLLSCEEFSDDRAAALIACLKEETT